MTPIVLEWLQKGRADLRTAQRELGVVHSPNYDAVCFHSQQAVEKALKALLCSQGIAPPKTHNLVYLIEQQQEKFPGLSEFREPCARLTEYAVEFRYPGDAATEEEARDAFEQAQGICQKLEKLFEA